MDNFDVVPARLREAREANGLSMKELSELIGVSSQAISQYEHGIIRPSILILRRISNMLEYPFEFFLKEKLVYNYSDETIFFRATKDTTKKIKDAYAYRIKWANEILSYFKNFIEFCKVNIPSLDEYDLSYEMSSDVIEDITQKVREYWNLGDGPIENLTEILEDNGFVLCKISFKNKKVEAFSQWNNGVPYIFFGANRESAVSFRFSIAHELGHLLMHYFVSKDDVFDKKKLSIMEEQANKFAAFLLMPSKTFSRDMISNSLDYLIYIKEKWKVSIGSIIKRCADLDILSENQAIYLYRQLAMKGYKKKEPLDDVIPIEEPELLKSALELLLDNGIIEKQLFLKDITLPKEEILNICSLTSDYFDNTSSKKNILKIIR